MKGQLSFQRVPDEFSLSPHSYRLLAGLMISFQPTEWAKLMLGHSWASAFKNVWQLPLLSFWTFASSEITWTVVQPSSRGPSLLAVPLGYTWRVSIKKTGNKAILDVPVPLLQLTTRDPKMRPAKEWLSHSQSTELQKIATDNQIINACCLWRSLPPQYFKLCSSKFSYCHLNCEPISIIKDKNGRFTKQLW